MISVCVNVVVLFISFRPPIKAALAYRRELQKLDLQLQVVKAAAKSRSDESGLRRPLSVLRVGVKCVVAFTSSLTSEPDLGNLVNISLSLLLIRAYICWPC